MENIVQVINEIISVQDIIIGLLVIILGYGVFRWMKKVMESDEDQGKSFVAKIYKQRVLLLEGIILFMNGAEAFVAASLGKTEEVEVNFASRAAIHSGIAAGGTIFGLTTSAQWAEAIQATVIAIQMSWDKLTTGEKINAIFILIKQWGDALFVTAGSIAAPLGNLYLISEGAGESDILLDPSRWSEMSYLLMGSTFVVVFHICIALYIGLVSMDKILQMNLDDIKTILEKRINEEKNLSWSNITGYIKSNIGADVSKIDDYINNDPTKKRTRKRELFKAVQKCIELRKVVDDLTSDDDEAEAKGQQLDAVHEDLKQKLMP